MKTVLLPVKDFRSAKQRLSSVLDADSRLGLARAMLADVLKVLSLSRLADRVVVFTAADEVIRMARSYGFDVEIEKVVEGHSAAVNRMVLELSASASRILAIAADLPKLSAGDVDFVLDAAAEPITLVPSRDGTGTNGVIFVPPARITMEYGEGSFSRHRSKAAAAGQGAGILNVPGIAFDMDTPEDLRAFRDDPRKDSETWRYLVKRV
ncbi:MAG: 2-phospho-L-lactate guanylyltransferase [Acidobacteria bacterium]|nr:MAG: 2-phospho-L-lactate guanylyltransferase [Acidobacteriota bacterium]